MGQIRANRGFTLIELLVVISIIVVLMAIIFPAFQSAREKARQTRCITNMHQIDIALKSYLQDYRRFPPPPYYNGGMQKYLNGPAALYPDYIQNHEVFICPDDRQIDGVQQQAMASNYCSYAGVPINPQASQWDFKPLTGTGVNAAAQMRLYNWGGYTFDGYDDCYFDTTSNTWKLGHDDPKVGGTVLPTWLSSQGMGWKAYPRLENRRAPDNTIVFHCVAHRDFYKSGDETDVMMKLGGEATTVKLTQMDTPDATGVAPWQSQQY